MGGLNEQPAQKLRVGEIPYYQRCLSVQEPKRQKKYLLANLWLASCHHFWLVARGPWGLGGRNGRVPWEKVKHFIVEAAFGCSCSLGN